MDLATVQQVSMIILTVTNIAVSLAVHFGYKSLYLEKVEELEETVIEYEKLLESKSTSNTTTPS